MKKLLVPLLLAACGDNLDPGPEDQKGAIEDPESPGSTPETPETPPNPPTDTGFFALFMYEPASCVDNSLRLLGRYGYDSGAQVENGICEYALADGTVLANTCFAVLPFPTAQEVVFTVTDPATGAVAQFSEVVQGPATLEASLAVTSSDLSISWDAHSIYGGVADVGSMRVAITPSENVIVDDPAVFAQTAGTVRVTQPGTYTVSATASIVFGEVGGCAAVTDRTFEVVCHHHGETHAH